MDKTLQRLLGPLIDKIRSLPISRLFGNDPPHMVRKQLDIFMCATALKCYNWEVMNKDPTARVNKDIVRMFVSELEEMFPYGRQRFVQQEINRQMIAIFKKYEQSLPKTAVGGKRALKNEEDDDDEEEEEEDSIIPSIFSSGKRELRITLYYHHPFFALTYNYREDRVKTVLFA